MNIYGIYEHGFRFALVTAPNAIDALRKAADLFPRTAAAYHVETGEPVFFVEWQAHLDAGGFSRGQPLARAQATVPGSGREGCTFEAE